MKDAIQNVQRKLVTLREVSEILPIEGADNIVKLVIDGWSCVAKKGEFWVGCPILYFEIDSFLPIRPEFEFLRKSSYRKMGDKEGFRIKTIRLKGVLSQGLALSPLKIPEIMGIIAYGYAKVQKCEYDEPIPYDPRNPWGPDPLNRIKIGDDFTELLGVLKYERPIPAELNGIAKGNFPSFIKKTDQERVQNVWKYIKDSTEYFEVTQKLDGTSATYYFHDGKFGVCSRNLDLEESESNTLWKIARRYDIEGMLRKCGRNIAIQGEVVGENIQKNPMRLKGQDFYVFDIWDIDSGSYLRPNKRGSILETEFPSLKHVPVILWDARLCEFGGLDRILQFAEEQRVMGSRDSGFEYLYTEGLVYKSHTTGTSFKVISNRYLLNE
jgi:RNA ligase (TIGR02306 family)